MKFRGVQRILYNLIMYSNIIYSKMSNINYAITYKCNSKKDPVESDYEGIIQMLSQKGILHNYVYERGTTGKLHIHCLWETSKKVMFRSMCPQGYHSKFVELYDELSWTRYMMKEQKVDNKIYLF